MTFLAASLIASAVVAIFPGKFAQRKGRRFWPWWLFGFVAFVPALIAVALVSDSSGRAGHEELPGRDTAPADWNRALMDFAQQDNAQRRGRR